MQIVVFLVDCYFTTKSNCTLANFLTILEKKLNARMFRVQNLPVKQKLVLEPDALCFRFEDACYPTQQNNDIKNYKDNKGWDLRHDFFTNKEVLLDIEYGPFPSIVHGTNKDDSVAVMKATNLQDVNKYFNFLLCGEL